MTTENEEENQEEPKRVSRMVKIAFESLQHRVQTLRYERDDYRGIILSIKRSLPENSNTFDFIRQEVDRILNKYPEAGVLAEVKS